MQLQLDQLYELLSTTTIKGVDHVFHLFELPPSKNEALYDRTFELLSAALKPLAMADREVGLVGRQQIIEAVFVRTGLEDIEQQLEFGRRFEEYCRANNAEHLWTKLSANQPSSAVWARLRSNLNRSLSQEFLYGNWIPQYQYRNDLQSLFKLAENLIIHGIRNEQSQAPLRGRSDILSSAQLHDILQQRMIETHTGKWSGVITRIKDESFFPNIARYLLNLDYHYYAKGMEKKAPPTQTKAYLFHWISHLSDDTKQELRQLEEQLNTLFKNFTTQYYHLMVEQWTRRIAQRAAGMIDAMEQAPMEYIVEVLNSERVLEQRGEGVQTSTSPSPFKREML